MRVDMEGHLAIGTHPADIWVAVQQPRLLNLLMPHARRHVGPRQEQVHPNGEVVALVEPYIHEDPAATSGLGAGRCHAVQPGFLRAKRVIEGVVDEVDGESCCLGFAGAVARHRLCAA